MGYQENQESLFGKLGKFIRPEEEKEKEKKGPYLILVGKLGKLIQIRKVHWVNQEILSANQENYDKLGKCSRNQEIFDKLGKFIKKIRKYLENQEK